MSKESYNFLFIDDDKAFIERYKRFAEGSRLDINPYKIIWNFCDNFNDGLDKVQENRYDLIMCDVQNNIRKEDEGYKIVSKIKQKQLCPIIIFSSGDSPNYVKPPFITFVSKVQIRSTEGLKNEIKNLMNYGVISIRKKLIEEIISEVDESSCNFAWNYINKHWETLKQDFTEGEKFNASKLKMIIRHQLEAKMSYQSMSNPSLYGYYLVPVKDQKITLGTILEYTDTESQKKRKGVVLTPHCYFESYYSREPRIDAFLVANCLYYNNLGEKQKKSVKENLRRALQIPITAGSFTPEGRYCFLPHLPGKFDDLFCDLNDLTKLPLPEQNLTYPPYAVLAQVLPPYAEALQSAFVKYYASVGIPNLNPEDFENIFLPEHDP